MNSFTLTAINTLKNYTTREWYNFFDSCFLFKILDSELAINYEFASEYFVELSSFIVSSEEYELLNDYHNNLISYYFDLPSIREYFSRVYTLHWVFANLKPRIRTEEFYHQLFKEDLSNFYYNKVHLHSSLLSLINQLPNLEAYDPTSYLMSSIHRIKDLSFFRVALRYLIEHNSISEYLDYFERISNQNEKISLVLTESIMDLRDYYGSFQQLYSHISIFWDKYISDHKTIATSITQILNDKYLIRGKKWFDDDPFAKMLKVHINSIENAPPVTIISDIFEHSKKYEDSKRAIIINNLSLIFQRKNKKPWKNEIVIDAEVNNLVSIYPYNSESELFYKVTYGIEKESSFILNANEGFRSFITRNCNPEYENIKKYDLSSGPYLFHEF